MISIGKEKEVFKKELKLILIMIVMMVMLFTSVHVGYVYSSVSDPCWDAQTELETQDCKMSVHIDICYIFAKNAGSDSGEFEEQKLKQCDHDMPSWKTACELSGNIHKSCTWDNLDEYLELRDLEDDMGSPKLYCQEYPNICNEHNLFE